MPPELVQYVLNLLSFPPGSAQHTEGNRLRAQFVGSPDRTYVTPDTVADRTVRTPDTVIEPMRGRTIREPQTLVEPMRGQTVRTPDTIVEPMRGQTIRTPDTIVEPMRGQTIRTPDTIVDKTLRRPLPRGAAQPIPPFPSQPGLPTPLNSGVGPSVVPREIGRPGVGYAIPGAGPSGTAASAAQPAAGVAPPRHAAGVAPASQIPSQGVSRLGTASRYAPIIGRGLGAGALGMSAGLMAHEAMQNMPEGGGFGGFLGSLGDIATRNIRSSGQIPEQFQIQNPSSPPGFQQDSSGYDVAPMPESSHPMGFKGKYANIMTPQERDSLRNRQMSNAELRTPVYDPSQISGSSPEELASVISALESQVANEGAATATRTGQVFNPGVDYEHTFNPMTITAAPESVFQGEVDRANQLLDPSLRGMRGGYSVIPPSGRIPELDDRLPPRAMANEGFDPQDAPNLQATRAAIQGLNVPLATGELSQGFEGRPDEPAGSRVDAQSTPARGSPYSPTQQPREPVGQALPRPGQGGGDAPYRVQSGDTLFDIAGHQGVDRARALAYAKQAGFDPDVIGVGQELSGPFRAGPGDAAARKRNLAAWRRPPSREQDFSEYEPNDPPEVPSGLEYPPPGDSPARRKKKRRKKTVGPYAMRDEIDSPPPR